jgi:UDP-N-acetylglucosamine--N-acetylmuramyl-(pentapeptide) pyrophosphoryl-undecaprenol N-acetylglucosamine transferase
MFPALALARALGERGREVALLTDRRGARYVGPGIACHLISAGSPSGSVGTALLGLGSLARGLQQCLALFLRLRPQAAACFGGYASVPPAVAAALARRPVMIHEQNAVFGKANRLIARFASKVALSFEHTERTGELAAPRLVTGNPVRPGFAAEPVPYSAPRAGQRFRVLVLGGSQGARVLSDVLPAAMALLPEMLRRKVQITQQCREEDLERARSAYEAVGMRPDLATFFDNVPVLMGDAHLVISRSGASTVAELLAVGCPSLLIPYAHAADDHQRANAAQLTESGAAEMMLQDMFTPGALAERLRRYLDDPGRLQSMAERARSLAQPEAAERLADAFLGMLPTGGRA